MYLKECIKSSITISSREYLKEVINLKCWVTEISSIFMHLIKDCLLSSLSILFCMQHVLGINKPLLDGFHSDTTAIPAAKTDEEREKSQY